MDETFFNGLLRCRYDPGYLRRKTRLRCDPQMFLSWILIHASHVQPHVHSTRCTVLSGAQHEHILSPAWEPLLEDGRVLRHHYRDGYSQPNHSCISILSRCPRLCLTVEANVRQILSLEEMGAFGESRGDCGGYSPLARKDSCLYKRRPANSLLWASL